MYYTIICTRNDESGLSAHYLIILIFIFYEDDDV